MSNTTAKLDLGGKASDYPVLSGSVGPDVVDIRKLYGNTGAFTGFMMQRGRMVVCGNAGKNLGDSMYDGTIYVGGDIKSLGVDAVEAELTELDKKWLTRKLTQYGLMPDKGVDHFTKVVAGKMLWNYDNLEPSEKKLIL